MDSAKFPSPQREVKRRVGGVLAGAGAGAIRPIGRIRRICPIFPQTQTADAHRQEQCLREVTQLQRSTPNRMAA